MRILKRSVRSGRDSGVKVLDKTLPIWVSDAGDDRLDNNYYSPSFFEAEKKLTKIGSISFEDAIREIRGGLDPSEGDIPLLEGKNVLPNVIFPSIEKCTEASGDDLLKENDILIVKDGSPGKSAVVLKPLLDYFNARVAAAEHLYVIRLKGSYEEFSPLITVFLNSKIGQSIVRRYITGAISPSISDEDLKEAPILDPLPIKEIARKIKEKAEEMQKIAISLASPTRLSRDLFSMLKMNDEISTSLPINWMPGGKRDAHGYYRK